MQLRKLIQSNSFIRRENYAYSKAPVKDNKIEMEWKKPLAKEKAKK